MTRKPRSEVVQTFLDQFDAPAYLEIGVERGLTFHSVRAARKVAVDPDFKFEVGKVDTDNPSYHEVMSDTYFGDIAQPSDQFDVIYLDGLHTVEQTLRDLLNATEHLKPDGVIIIDDVWPISFVSAMRDLEEHKTLRDKIHDDNPAWMGDVYKLLYVIDTFFQKFTMHIISDNYGQAILWRQRRRNVIDRNLLDISLKTYDRLILDGHFSKIPVTEVLAQYQYWKGSLPKRETYTRNSAVEKPRSLIPLSTRIFPKGRGANQYRLTGIAGKCDWCVLSDNAEPQIHLHKNNQIAQPKYIFLSLRSPFVAINYFAETLLPTLTEPFVLVSGSEDVTIPTQTDKRWRSYSDQERKNLLKISEHPLLTHWYAENLDADMGEKVTAIPLGMVMLPEQDPAVEVPNWPQRFYRPATVFCAHRIRNGPQWEQRRRVNDLAKRYWQPWCSIVEEELPEAAFLQIAQQHGFIICAGGGGLDPSPKAWQALLHGIIPIIKSSRVADAYRDLPCVIVDDWTPDCLSPEKLTQWAQELDTLYDQAATKEIFYERLSLDYWWARIQGHSFA